jgi:hypothetical protein
MEHEEFGDKKEYSIIPASEDCWAIIQEVGENDNNKSTFIYTQKKIYAFIAELANCNSIRSIKGREREYNFFAGSLVPLFFDIDSGVYNNNGDSETCSLFIGTYVECSNLMDKIKKCEYAPDDIYGIIWEIDGHTEKLIKENPQAATNAPLTPSANQHPSKTYIATTTHDFGKLFVMWMMVFAILSIIIVGILLGTGVITANCVVGHC